MECFVLGIYRHVDLCGVQYYYYIRTGLGDESKRGDRYKGPLRIMIKYI